MSINRIPIIGETVKKEPLKKASVPYSHQKVIEQFLKCIADSDMSDVLKMVLRMRIWGVRPNVFYPLTHEQIGYVLARDGLICQSNKTTTLDELEKYMKGIDVFGPDKVKRNNVVQKAVNAVAELEQEGLAHIKDHLIRCGLLNIEYRFQSKDPSRFNTWLGKQKRFSV